MSTPQLSDRMNDLAADVSAPPTAQARAAVGRRARTIRRRHRARQAAGGGLLAAVVAAAVLTAGVTSPNGSEPETAEPDAVTLPALTVDLAGWNVADAEEVALDPSAWDLSPSGSLQVFRRPGDLTGPTVFLRHNAASDTVVPLAGQSATFTSTSGREVSAWLVERQPGTFSMWWSDAGDWAGEILSWGLTRDEVLAFAAGLAPIDDAISYPPVGEHFGFTTAVLPSGLVEVPAEDPSGAPSQRRVTAVDGDVTAHVVVDDRGTVAVASELTEVIASGGSIQPVTVLGRPAVLGQAPDGTWIATWFQSADGAATVTFADADRATVDAVLAGLRELPESEWDDLAEDRAAP